MANYIGTNKLGNNGGRAYNFLNKPVAIDCSFTVTPSNGLGITNLIGSGVQNVFMYTSTTAGAGANGYINPMAQSASQGYALIQLANNYNRYCGLNYAVIPPNTGSSLAINSTALTVGSPYVINAVGAASAGTVTIAPVADVSGSLASTWFSLFDAYGNTWVIWFSVSGIGAAPKNVNGTLVQQTIASGATAATIGAALVTTIANLPSGTAGVNAFTASGTTTVTVVSTQTNPIGPLPGVPMDGAIPTGFTFAQTVLTTLNQAWRGVGLPRGVKPAVGASFIATATGYSTGGSASGTVQLPGKSGIGSIEIVGNPNMSIAPAAVGVSSNIGSWILLQFLAPTSSSVTTPIVAAPLTGSLITLNFNVEAASIVIAGE